MLGYDKPGTIHLDAKRASECGYNPATLGFFYEVQTKTVRSPKGIKHEVEWEVIGFPEVQDARLYEDKNVILTVLGRKWEVRITIDWEDCHNEKGPVIGALVDFIPTEKAETPYTEWGEDARHEHQQKHLVKIREELDEVLLQAQATYDTFLNEEVRYLEGLLDKGESALKEGRTLSTPRHKSRYFGQPVFLSETVTPIHDNKAVPLLCTIPTTGDAILNIFVAFDGEGNPCKAFFHETGN